jgi:hypothetical protein
MKHTIPHSSKKDYNNRHRHRPRLPCPVCTFERLIDTGEFTRSKTYAPGEDGYLNADYYQKCSSCKAEIGIRKIE